MHDMISLWSNKTKSLSKCIPCWIGFSQV